MKDHINKKIIILVRLDPYLQGIHSKKEKYDKLLITAILNLNFSVLVETINT